MMRIRGAGRWVLAAATAVFLSACGGAERPKVVPVSGTILYNGEPIADARVGFHSKDGSPRVASGVTDSEGHFTLTTFDSGDGAVPGTHVVTIHKPEETGQATEMSAENPGEDYHKAMMAATNWKPADIKSKVPVKYATADSSPEQRTVSEEGPNEFTIELTD